MKHYEQQLQEYMEDWGIQGRQTIFAQACHSVAQAAAAIRGEPNDLVKNICFLDDAERLIVAIVRGGDRVSTSRAAKAAAASGLRPASPAEILQRTGYPCGGVPSFGYAAIFLVDPKITERTSIYSGGGSPHALVQLSPAELLRANQGQLVRVRS